MPLRSMLNGMTQRAAALQTVLALTMFAVAMPAVATAEQPSQSADSATPQVKFRVVAKLDHPVAMGLAWSPNGRYLAATGLFGPGSTRSKLKPKSVSLWDMSTYALVRTINQTLGGGHSLAFTADGAHVLFALPQDPAMPATTAFSLWNVATGAIDRHVAGPYQKRKKYGIALPDGREPEDFSNAAERMATSPDGLYLAAVYLKQESGDPIGIYDLQTLKLISTDIRKERWGASALAMSPDGRHLAIGQYNGEVRIVDFIAAKTVLTFKAHAPVVGNLAYSPDGKRLVSGSGAPGHRRDEATGQMIEYRDDDPIRVWDVATGQLVHSYKGDFGQMWGLAWSPNGRYIASASDLTARLWDARAPRLLGNVKKFQREAVSVAFDQKSRRLAAGGEQGIVIVEIVDREK